MSGIFLRLALATFVAAIPAAVAQEITLEEVRVESTYVSPLDLPMMSNSLQKFLERLRLDDDLRRSAELQEANKGSMTRMIDLTRYIPIPLGGSDPRYDPSAPSYLRADLTPPKGNPLFGRE
jgi:hypothetical protein